MAHRIQILRHHRLARFTLLLAGAICAPAWIALAEDDISRDEAQKAARRDAAQLHTSREQEQGLAQDIATLAAERARLNSELIDAAARVQASEAKLSETEGKLAELTDQVTVIRNSITERKVAIVKMLSAMQRIGRTPPPALVTRRDDALAMVRSAMLLAEVFPELKYQADNLSRELDGLVTLEGGIREQRDAEKAETDRLAEERTRADQLLEEKRIKLAQSQTALSQVRLAAQEQAATVSDLNELIQKLDQQIAKAEVAQYDAELAAERALRAKQQDQALAVAGNERVVEIKPDSNQSRFCQP